MTLTMYVMYYLLWYKDWQLEYNVSQSHALLYKINPLLEYYFDRNCIESFDQVNEYGIGVDIDPVLKFGKHVVCIVAKECNGGNTNYLYFLSNLYFSSSICSCIR